ncbi:MAG: hypothetical protein ACPG40_09550 [Alphaproteobacteria bacterium]
MKLTTIMHVGAAVAAVLALSACGRSQNDDVVAEDIFAPASDTGDDAIDAIQTVFDDPFAAEAQLITDSGGEFGGELDPLIDQAFADDPFGEDPFADDPFLSEQTGLTDAYVDVEPIVSQPIYQETIPAQFQPGQPTFNCNVAPTSKSQLMLFRQYCGGIAPQGGGYGGGAPEIFGSNNPSQQVFVSPGFDCANNPTSKAELAYYRANCLSQVAAPITAPEIVPVAVAPDSGFADDFADDFSDDFTDFESEDDLVPDGYDCNILPTSRVELELYQKFCG